MIAILTPGVAWVMKWMIDRSSMRYEQVLRQEMVNKVSEQWQRFAQNVPLKVEWEARRAEIDRRLDELRSTQTEFRESMEGIDKVLRDQTILLEQIRARQ